MSPPLNAGNQPMHNPPMIVFVTGATAGFGAAIALGSFNTFKFDRKT